MGTIQPGLGNRRQSDVPVWQGSADHAHEAGECDRDHLKRRSHRRRLTTRRQLCRCQADAVVPGPLFAARGGQTAPRHPLRCAPAPPVGTTDRGRIGVSASAARQGISEQALLKRYGGTLTPEAVGRGVVSLVTDDTYKDGIAYRLTGQGLESLD